MTAGYSGTPLPAKLGIKVHSRAALAGAPPGFEATLDPLPSGAVVSRRLSRNLDCIIAFVRERGSLEDQWDRLTGALTPAGMLWIAWPKKASKVPTDMTEDVVRDVALPGGLVDNKVCAIDEVWSGLRCVIRLENRSKPAR